MITIQEIKNKLLSIDPSFAESRIIAFLRHYFKKTGAKKAIIGVSGGIDSSVVLALAVKALGKERVIAVLMPYEGITPEQDIRDAKELISMLDVNYVEISINGVVKIFENKLVGRGINLSKVARGNILARVRMVLLYAIANSEEGLVMGSSDKSELLLGYFTKYGDGGVDLLPIGDLYKTQVRLLGRHLGIPEKIVNKPSSPSLWKNHMAEEELGARYEVIDPILYALVDLKISPDRILEIEGIPKDLAKEVISRVFMNEHKRSFPIIPKISKGMTIGYDWRYPVLGSFPL